MHKYGLKGPDKTDHRDFIFSTSRQLKLPAKFSLKSKCIPIYDQGNLNDCVINAGLGVSEFNDFNDGDGIYVELSRLMLYYLTRVEDGDVPENNGTYIRTMIKVFAEHGTCKESLWPNVESKFTIKPTKECYVEALNHAITSYHRILALFDMKACLFSGRPFILGIPIYESFESCKVAESGKIPMPKATEDLQGYHAVYSCGYDDDLKVVECANSWGNKWGNKGFFTLPYRYLEKFVIPEGAGDCWTIIK